VPRRRLRVAQRTRDDDLRILATAPVIVSVGAGVMPEEYPLVAPLLHALDAELAATRKVTDLGWQPRSRQVGITGRSVAPRLFVAIGTSGTFNHMVGARGAKIILAINNDPAAPVFKMADIGILADWRQAVPRLAEVVLRSGRPMQVSYPRGQHERSASTVNGTVEALRHPLVRGIGR
jgi:electron transfer flavoprotein alpha subunit